MSSRSVRDGQGRGALTEMILAETVRVTASVLGEEGWLLFLELLLDIGISIIF